MALSVSVSVALLAALACTCSAAATNQSLYVWQPSPGGGNEVVPPGGGGSEVDPPAEADEDAGVENALEEITQRINNLRVDYYGAKALENNATLNNIARTCADSFQYRYQTFDPAMATAGDKDTYNYNGLDVYRCKAAEQAGHLEYYCLATKESSKTAELAANNCLQQWIGTERDKYEERKKQEYADDTRHFTQIVWKATERFGCAVTEQIELGKAVDQRALICLYDPSGNQRIAFSDSLAFKANVELPKN